MGQVDDAQAATAVDTGDLAATQAATDDDRVSTSQIRAPFSIPGFRVHGRLGEGGMGTVYAGEQESPSRPVAIKLLHVDAGPALARFLTEADIMARLDHPGIARVVQAGDANGHPYIVMERVEGQTLDEFVASSAPPLAKRLALFAAICDAVHHAHVNGVIHRDLKPSNIMVRGGSDRIVVLDFGIARAQGVRMLPATTSGSDATSSAATRAGELIGTPLYMSPEQARLRPDEVDARSDVYSLGVTLYELVAGQLPYPVRNLPIEAVSVVICDDPPKPLVELGFDRDLDAIAAKALAKAPADRYQSAAALADDIRRRIDGRIVTARVPGTFEQVVRFARRRPVVAGGIAASIAVIVGFAAIVTHMYLGAEAARESLAQRTADLTLQQARTQVARDPTAALAMLDEVRGAVDPELVDIVADEARGRGVSSHVLTGHLDEVHSVEGLRDGSIVSASLDGTVRIWEAPFVAGRVVWDAHHDRIHVVCSSPDGSELAVGSDDGRLRVIDRAGHSRAELRGHTGNVDLCVWRGDWLVTADHDGGVFVWPHGEAAGRKLAGPAIKVEMIGMSDDGASVLAGDKSGVAWLWNLTTGALRQQTVGTGAVRGVWASGDQLAAATGDGEVRRWRGDVLESSVDTHTPSKRAMFAPGGRYVVLAGNEGTILRVDGTTVEPLGALSAKVRGLAISTDARRIAAGSEDGIVQAWDRETGRHVTLRGHHQRIRELAFAGHTLLSADGGGVIRSWDLDAIPPTFFDEHRAPIEQIAVASDGHTVVSSDANNAIGVIDLVTGSSRSVGQQSVHVTAIGLAGDRVVSGDVVGIVTWWGGPKRDLGSAVRVIATSPDGHHVAACTDSGAVALFTGDGTPIAVAPGHAPSSCEALAFDRTGLLASGGRDHRVRLWRDDGTPIGVIDSAKNDIRFIQFSPAGDLLAATGDDGQVRAWRVRNGAVDTGSTLLLGKHKDAITAMAFDAAGRWIATAGRDAILVRAEVATQTIVKAPTSHRGDIGIAIDDRGDVMAANESGDVDRWSPSDAIGAVPVTQGTSAAVPIGHGSLLLGSVDGSLRVLRGSP